MGSGNNNRKETDTVIVRRPKLTNVASGVSNAPMYGVEQCIPSFDILINQNVQVRDKMKVYLVKQDDSYSILSAGQIVGSLNKKYSSMISVCMSMGVKYWGEIVIIKEKKYARFIRVL